MVGVEINADGDKQEDKTKVLKADHYVVALGSYSRELMLGLGLQIPVYPVKGYSSDRARSLIHRCRASFNRDG